MDRPETLEFLRREARQKLPQDSESNSEFVAREIDTLLCDLLGCTTVELFLRLNELVTPETATNFRKSIDRLVLDEPLAYIRGRQEFYGREFIVTPDVLIPRPDTEVLVERSLAHFDSPPKEFSIIDVGTGSGAIILSVVDALRDKFGEPFLKRGTYTAIDISLDALKVAQQNAARLGLESVINFRQGDLLSGLSPAPVPVLIIANLPYIPDREVLPPSVANFEPMLALRAGIKGLDLIERLIDQSLPWLNQGSILLLEIGWEQSSDVLSLAQSRGRSSVAAYRDLQGIERVIEIQ